jgi:predicted RNA binding protein YcfA (HicA-like mRNA interferase family)
MNWIKSLNNIDKNFYDKCADIAISSLYEMEEITDITIKSFQEKSIEYFSNKNSSIDVIKTPLMESLDKMNSLYEINQKRFMNLFDSYQQEINIMFNSINNKTYNMLNKRLLLSRQKSGYLLKSTLNELAKLQENLVKDIVCFKDTYFVFKENDKEQSKDATIDITDNIDKNIEKTKIQYNKIFKQRDLIKYLEENGFTYKNTGRHANYTDGVNTIPVPIHGSKDLGYGLQRKIQKEVVMNRNI